MKPRLPIVFRIRNARRTIRSSDLITQEEPTTTFHRITVSRKVLLVRQRK